MVGKIMKDEKKTKDSDLEERIRNTAELLAGFARENLDENSAAEIDGILSDILKKDEQ